MRIKAGASVIDVDAIFSEKFFFEGTNRPCLKIDLPRSLISGLTKEQLTDLLCNDIIITDNDGAVMGTYQDYSAISEFCITLVQVKPLELVIADMEAQFEKAKVELIAKAEAEKEELRRTMAENQIAHAAAVEKAVADERFKASNEVQAVREEKRQAINSLSSSYEMELEQAITAYRNTLRQSTAVVTTANPPVVSEPGVIDYPLGKDPVIDGGLVLEESPVLDTGSDSGSEAVVTSPIELTSLDTILEPVLREEISNEVLDWNPLRRYLAGERVTGYIALRFSRGQEPAQNLGTYWAVYEEIIPIDWMTIPEMTIVEEGTLVNYNELVWACISRHLKSDTFKPETGSPKWEISG